ncbi:MAG: sugar ABC transporter permease [Clostridia bacterium]|nr:sugar ABC transporter permease [Clostridia bacterium]
MRRGIVLYRKREFLLMLPGVMGFFLFYVLPFLMTCVFVFIRSPFDSTFVGFQNLGRTLQNGYFQMALRHTAVFTLLSVSLTLALTLALTFMLYNCPFPFHSPFVLPVLLPTVAVAMVWNVLFGRDSTLSGLGLPPQSALYVLFVWKNTGLHVIFLLSALAQLPKELMEAASIDGAGMCSRFRHIVLPHLLPTLFFCCVYAIMCSFRIFRESYLLYGTYPHESLFMVQHYIHNQFAKLRYPEVASAGFLYAIPVILLVALIFRLQSNWQEANQA